MLIVPEVSELWSGHEYSFHSSGKKSEMRFLDVSMATRSVMNQLLEDGIINKEKIKARVSNSTLILCAYNILFRIYIPTYMHTYQRIKYMHIHWLSSFAS
jgi:hypothetical protein